MRYGVDCERLPRVDLFTVLFAVGSHCRIDRNELKSLISFTDANMPVTEVDRLVRALLCVFS